MYCPLCCYLFLAIILILLALRNKDKDCNDCNPDDQQASRLAHWPTRLRSKNRVLYKSGTPQREPPPFRLSDNTIILAHQHASILKLIPISVSMLPPYMGDQCARGLAPPIYGSRVVYSAIVPLYYQHTSILDTRPSPQLSSILGLLACQPTSSLDH